MPSFDPARAYNDLPPLPPRADLETRAVLKACIEASRAVAEPNQDVLINTIPLLEARASSEIENIVTTTDQIFRYAQPDREALADPATKEALRYRTALRRWVEVLKKRPLAMATAVEVCRTWLGVNLDIRRVPGTALVNEATGEVVYTPPEGEAVLQTLLVNWERFLHDSEDLDPLVRMAVAHYQFEAIHPFSDGNGRTGRILNLLLLIERELLELPVLYLSRAIIRQKADYYRLLLAVTARGAWETGFSTCTRRGRDGSLDHRTYPGRPPTAAGHRRVCAGGSLRGVQWGAGRAHLCPALLPHQERRRGRHRPAADGGGVPQATGEGRRAGGDQGGP
jgi:Fic family protein